MSERKIITEADFPNEIKVCSEICEIMAEYDRQLDERGYVGTPGGLEHMGDVWKLLNKWREMILSCQLTQP